MPNLTRAEKADRYETLRARAQRATALAKSKRQNMTRKAVQGGSAFVGGALFAENYAAAGMVGIGGIVLEMTGNEGHLSDGLQAVGIGATYMYGAKHPPQVLQGVAAAIQGKLSTLGV